MNDDASEKIGALSVDAQWVADKLSEFGFTVDQLEALYPEAERVALGWAARGDTRIGIDLVTGEVKRRTKLKFSNTVRPFSPACCAIAGPSCVSSSRCRRPRGGGTRS